MKKRHDNSLTKIIATIGPACSDKDTLRKMFYSGIDVCRLNFSHGDYHQHLHVIKNIRQLNEELQTAVAILADLQGPKLRIGQIEGGSIEIAEGEELLFTNKECTGSRECLYMSYASFPQDVDEGDIVLIDDGKLKLEVVNTNKKDKVILKVRNGGTLSSRKGVNLPNTKISLPSLTKKDREDVEFALEHNVDWIALSFVRNATDITDLKKIIKSRKKHTKVIAKIEKPEALNEISEIISLSDAIMIARGDLGVEVPFDQVPIIQKQIIHKCIIAAKPVIIATQMMESMITNFRPTRAEANDVANAVLDGADTLMLSGETSVGRYPVEAIKSMQQIIDATEGKKLEKKYKIKPDPELPTFLHDAICYSAATLAKQIDAKAIVILTYSGYAAFRIASYRTNTQIIVLSSNETLLNQLTLAWGIQAFDLRNYETFDEFVTCSTKVLRDRNLAETGDNVVFVGSIPYHEKGLANVVRAETIK
jgi:pyruvate kinase